MKFRCSRERLLDGLQMVGSVVSTRGMKPVYESVLIQSRDDRLLLKGTDLEVAIRYELEDPSLAIEEAGALVVPAARLTAIVREVKDETISCSWDDTALDVECLGSQFRVMGLPAEEFPEIPEFPDEATVTLPSALFKRMVARTAFAAAREKMRYALNGVLLSLEGSTIQLVGTDGRRLAHTKATVENPESAEIHVIVPTKGVNQIAKVLGEEEETLDLALMDNQLAARTARAVVVSRLVEGTYPNFDEVIPGHCEKKARVSREEFAAAIRKARLVTSKESQSVRFIFGEEGLALRSWAAEVGEARVSVPVEYEGEASEIAFNPTYLLEGLAVMDGEMVSFEFRNPTSPAKVSDGEEFTYVVMPISLET
jgi:DNA polymerase-3 subunit beta